MFIAHLPAGYLVSRPLPERPGASARALTIAAMIGSVFPDVDMLWWFFADRHTPHHLFPTHLPFDWLILWLAAIAATTAARAPVARAIASAFAVGVFSHLVLDSVAAGICWAYPFDTRMFGLIHVPNRFAWWPMNFFLHWTFFIEIALLAAALFVWIRDRRLRAARRGLVTLKTRSAAAKQPIVIEPSRRYSDLLVIRRAGDR